MDVKMSKNGSEKIFSVLMLNNTRKNKWKKNN